MANPRVYAASVTYIRKKWLTSDLLSAGTSSHFSRTAANAYQQHQAFLFFAAITNRRVKNVTHDAAGDRFPLSFTAAQLRTDMTSLLRTSVQQFR
jgi:hypothetical protein